MSYQANGEKCILQEDNHETKSNSDLLQSTAEEGAKQLHEFIIVYVFIFILSNNYENSIFI